MFATGSTAGVAQQPARPFQSLPRPRPRARPVVEGPEDFEQFRSDLCGRVELESTAAQAQKQPRAQPKSFTIDLTQARLAKEQLHAGPKAKAFKAFSGKPVENGIEKIQAYQGVPKRKPPGETAAPATTKNYNYPLVDFHQGLFVNANLSQASISSRYQDPRIPAMEFASRGLADEVNAELARLRVPDEKEVIRPKIGVPDEKEVVRPKSRAWMSPGSPLNQNAYELEASAPGFPILQAKAVNVRSHTPRIVRVTKRQEFETASPVSPLSSDAGKINFREYNWPRFVDKEFVDPAEEHSRRYRYRRREVLKERDRSPD
ncbi:hypothetical protein G647_00427 [Cladophialophora carrionii CBS 160.54]|uniref:Uncharacterized protein n=1 Tax=Cladophialophora carrionii CBS 160.54 TaxID=1279043 RepID=V9DNU8_9EURO|nr:uncharacterized protein G647_00427 [Cladophialophora carrionii CBS 160.54]ETI27978.1 hypothetical protein G647_00427 [Cladophialophora carrionii CBS 160.54]